MVIAGFVLLLIGYLLPELVAVPGGIIHAAIVIGWLLLIVGIILLVLGWTRGPIAGRRYWW